MILRNCNMKVFSERCDGKKIACYGIGGEFDRIIKAYCDYEWVKRIEYLVDGDETKQGNCITINEKEYGIKSLTSIINNISDDTVIMITSMAYYEIVNMLNEISAFDKTECYLVHYMFAIGEGEQYEIRQTKEAWIPPVIHYCWFGGKSMPDLYKKYIDSWYKYCPNYEIKEWNESNCNIDEVLYTSQAYKVGKYGFVPDYFRLKIIYEQGGIYLDTDVEILKNLDDLRYNKAFCGLEFPGEANLGLGFGACKKNLCIKKMLDRYKNMSFINSDGSYDETASPIFQSEDLMKMGMNRKNKLQMVKGMTIYPIEVLSPQNVYNGVTSISNKTYMWHHFDGSWITGKKYEVKKKRMMQSAEIYRLICEEDRKVLRLE